MPAAILDELHDCLTLALDATERPHRYSQTEREARSYVRAARHIAARLIGGAA
ncbi:MAG: hypothetical protein R3E47_04770 [Paracoccaceae bacterium]